MCPLLSFSFIKISLSDLKYLTARIIFVAVRLACYIVLEMILQFIFVLYYIVLYEYSIFFYEATYEY